jgi:hypothetical protein
MSQLHHAAANSTATASRPQVYKDSILADAESLEAKGVTEGDAVVLLPLTAIPKAPQDTTPVRCSNTLCSQQQQQQQQQLAAAAALNGGTISA